MKYNDCLSYESPLFSKLLNGLENKSYFYFSVQKVSLGDTIVSREQIERWKIIKDDEGQLYLGSFRTRENVYKKPRIYVVTLRTNTDNTYHILEQPKYNNLSNLKGLL